MRILSILIVAGLASPSAAAETAVTKRVEIEGVPYRVTVKGQAVTVARKTVFSKWDISERDAQRAAVRLATGCSIVDELPGDDARLRGKLACAP